MGGGIYLVGSSRLDGVTVEGNHATDLGGGVVVDYLSEIRNAVITANVSDLVGGGIGTEMSDLGTIYAALVADSTITANVASVSGGGAHVQGPFESDNCDWGEKATQNDPDDVTLVTLAGVVRSYDGFGAAEDFVCNIDPGRCH